jgi:hypothetical protein
LDKPIITAGCDSSVSYLSSRNCPPPTREVIGLGGHVRVGAEDNPSVSPGHLADSNAQ